MLRTARAELNYDHTHAYRLVRSCGVFVQSLSCPASRRSDLCYILILIAHLILAKNYIKTSIKSNEKIAEVSSAKSYTYMQEEHGQS